MYSLYLRLGYIRSSPGHPQEISQIIRQRQKYFSGRLIVRIHRQWVNAHKCGKRFDRCKTFWKEFSVTNLSAA